MDNDTGEKDFATGKGRLPLDESRLSPTNGVEVHHQSGGHQRLVFADPAAFRYLEEDPSITVLERSRRLKGYELYMVEQWACSRVHPTFVIVTYTGLEQHSVLVGVLGVPTNEELWSRRLRVYLKAVTKDHARKKDTPLGTLMVTNLSGFPSALTVVSIPDGDLKAHRQDLIVNENMKRLGCSGRAALNLNPPNGATQAKFSRLYHTSNQLPVSSAVVELVKLCQAALLLYGKLAPEYADGLLCDVTEQAINDWWTELGTEFFNVDPSDGILGPTTVSALLGMLMGARNRLNAYGAPVAKDVFDIASTKRGIAYFQKSQKMERSRRFDRQTLDRLHRATAKAASGQGWTVPRAVKSTVAELSGKGGDLVNGREKAGIAEVETLDIETFIHLGSGERFKWLWYGKPRKSHENDAFSNLGGDDRLIYDDAEQGASSWTGKGREITEDDTSLRHALSDRIYLHRSHGSDTSVDQMDKDQTLRRAVLKNVTGKATDARAGLGRIRDAVGRRGLRGHQSKYSKESNLTIDGDSLRGPQSRESGDYSRPSEIRSDIPRLAESPFSSGEQSKTGSKDSSRRGSSFPEESKRSKDTSSLSPCDWDMDDNYDRSFSSFETPAANGKTQTRSDYMNLIDSADGINARYTRMRSNGDSGSNSLTKSDQQAIQKMEQFDWVSSKLPPLRTTRSLSQLTEKTGGGYWDRRWPRQMSFTAIVDVVAAGVLDDGADPDDVTASPNVDKALAFENSLAAENRIMDDRLQSLTILEVAWVERTVAKIEDYNQQCGQDQSKLDIVYHQKLEENNALHEVSEELLAEERSSLTGAIKNLEVLGAKLEYELSALQSKVEDVEDGVAEFERQVEQTEMRAQELDDDNQSTNSWTGIFSRRFGLDFL